MNKKLVMLLLGLTIASSSAQAFEMSCLTGELKTCSEADLQKADGRLQIVVLPTGFTQNDKAEFQTAFQNYATNMVNAGADVYSQKYKDKFLFVSYWLPGETLESNKATLGGQIIPHPIRENFGIVIDEDKVNEAIVDIQRENGRYIKPWCTVAIFNTTKDTTANAKTPSFMSSPYGIVLVTKTDVKSSYLVSHETAHGGLNFLDEYVEPGFTNLNIHSVDVMSAFAAFGEGWDGLKAFWENIRGLYPIKISDILANNGSENIALDKFPARVTTPGHSALEYAYEGGMFFGRGTYHHAGDNLMNTSYVSRGPDDGFAFDHSRSQLDVIEQALDNVQVASRPNDRIKNQGPVDKLQFTFGGDTYLMLFDADKNHHYHPSTRYDVQIGWWERNWKWCKAAFIPYPCYENKWMVVGKSIRPTIHTIHIKETKLFGLAKFARFLSCDLGLAKIPKKSREQVKRFCSHQVNELAEAFVPSLDFATPYQKLKVPVSQAFTKYYWRFRTENGTYESGWTAWSDFSRAF
ncbi:MAG: hypothetical protein A2X86_20645 [Bdellovibrionales bacterium GWA2_49_15]|nr:MAG: hypothetical protein A2X86_20645 [Bdellovibrionales bacterium GWA2_49_15]HAZ11275.1 hypothetical protein [Bdellovibrionales bacterium]